MELEEEEAQICRLCGQTESIYIDVFGEEGTKRLLGVKIHAKINILIKENDGLPHKICMRCLGTLEFICDFYELCDATQKDLHEACYNPAKAKFPDENGAESDKENAFSSTKDLKCKTKASSANNLKRTKSCSTKNNLWHCEIKSKNETNVCLENSNNLVNTSGIEVTQPAVPTIVPLSNCISKKQSTLNGTISQEKKSEGKQIGVDSLKCERSEKEEQDISNKKMICAVGSDTTKNFVNLAQQNTIGTEDVSTANTNVCLRRKGGRKSKLKKQTKPKRSLNSIGIKRETENNIEDKNVDDFNGHSKRQCLRTISMNDKFDMVDATMISNKSQNEKTFVEREQVSVGIWSNESSVRTDKNVMCQKLTITETKHKRPENINDTLKKVEQFSARSKPVSIIVKQEKEEAKDESFRSIENLNHFVWVPSDILMQNVDKFKLRTDKVITYASPPPGDEAERNKTSECNSQVENNITDQFGISASTSRNDLPAVMYSKQHRVTVITKSPHNNRSTAPGAINNHYTESNNIKEAIDQSSDYVEQTLLPRSSRNNLLINGNKNKDGTFGRISELISDQHKEVIETFYKLNMSVVDLEEVQKHLTIINKKNIRCNICNTLYLRMDKCQVHIWSHLNMKPYQCTACDFATVTVSNVRCHIRKSHLKLKPFACHLCNKRYVTGVLLDEHLNTHTGARPFKCKMCDFASASRQMLSYHNTTHKTIKDIRCKVCGKEFYSRGRLRAHMFIHNKDKVVMCKLCSAYLSSEAALEMHHKNIHMRDYICNVCGKCVKSRKALQNHQNVHAIAKYKCSLCPNVYKSSQILKEHLLKHEGIRKYKCNVCGKSFGQQSHLAAHMAVHSKIRFLCPGCDKAFNRHDNMKVHSKRCKLVLDNPSLMEFLTKKEKPKSMNKPKDIGRISRNIVPSSYQHIENPRKNKIDADKIDKNLCQLESNIFCADSTNKFWKPDVVEDTVVVTNSAENDVICIADIEANSILETENLTIREKVLGPENF